MPCPKSNKVEKGHVRIVHESWNTDLWIYKSIGTKIVAQKAVQEGKWWCLWLCKRWTWKPLYETHLRLAARFYAAYTPTPILVATAGRDEFRVSEIRFEIWSFGFGSLKLTDAGFQYRPSGAPSLNVDGVQSDGNGSARYEDYIEYPATTGAGCTGAGSQP